MAAVVRPIGIQYTNFCFYRVAAFALKVVLQELDIQVVHGKPHLVAVGFKGIVVHINKAVYNRNVGRLFYIHFKSLRLFIVCKA